MGRFLIINTVESNFAISKQDLSRRSLPLNFRISVLMRSFNVSVRNGAIGYQFGKLLEIHLIFWQLPRKIEA